jgi:hypothetical protein
MLRKGWIAALASTALLLTSCGKAPEQKQASANSAIPTQAELDKLKGEGRIAAAREASALELWLHYKLMQANGMEAALGGEQQAVAALTTISAAFERSARGAEADVARLIPAAYETAGMALGVMGVGKGIWGAGALATANSRMTSEQVARVAEGGPHITRERDKLNQVTVTELTVTQGGAETMFEQTVNENGVTGTVKSRVHMDACPDVDGKLVVTIDSESQMGHGGISGSVKANFRYERWLTDDARLSEDTSADLQIEMSSKGGSSGDELRMKQRVGVTREGKGYAEGIDQRGYSIFRPEEEKQTNELRRSTFTTLIATAEQMLRGLGGAAPWESGRCVDLQVRSDPAKRTGAKPNTAYTLYAEPRSRLDGLPTKGTVTATLEGKNTLNPTGKVKADARYDYANPDKKNEAASITFEARSKRGVGKASLAFDTKENRGWRIVGGQNDFQANTVVCSLTEPFDIKSSVGIVMHMSGGDGGGNYTVSGKAAGVSWSGGGSYTLAMNGDGSGSLKAKGTSTIASPMGRFSDAVAPTFSVTPVEQGCGK